MGCTETWLHDFVSGASVAQTWIASHNKVRYSRIYLRGIFSAGFGLSGTLPFALLALISIQITMVERNFALSDAI
jgi:hypothetical protein